MKLGLNDTRAMGYKVTERILNICINYANQAKGPTKHSMVISAERL